MVREVLMNRTMRFVMAAALAFAAAGSGFQSDATLTASAAAARAKAQPNWKLKLETENGAANATLERFDIFLTEDEDHESEIFEIHGPDAVLVGVFPSDLHVGYEAAYERAVGRTLDIQPSGGDPGEPKSSWVRINGFPVPVAGGHITIDKVTGKWEGSEGDRTYWGTAELRIATSSGERTVRGRFAVNCVTWG
jgi:hypothetical protein